MKTSIISLIVGLTFSFAAMASGPRFHFKDTFDRADQAALKDWINDYHSGLETLFGELDYTYDVNFHTRASRRDPVPWANTQKGHGRRAVNFHVDLSHGWDVVQKDWTAPHELSHLMFPYVGRDGSWFAEGIASYLQYQAMFATGTLTWDRAIARYKDRFRAAAQTRRSGDTPISKMPQMVRQTRSFVRMYWGGAAYFLNVDQALSEQTDMRLNDVIRQYMDCCFSWRDDENDVIAKFDRISGTSVFSDVKHRTVDQRGFPPTADALAWLADNPPKFIESE